MRDEPNTHRALAEIKKKKYYKVHKGNEACGTLRGWVVESGPEFAEVKITSVSKHVGAILLYRA